MYDNLRTILLVALVGIGAVAAPVAAASAGSITASPATAGATSTHTVTVTVGSASTGSLNGLQVDYSGTGTDISNVGVENVLTVGIDRDDDAAGATIDQDVSNDLESAQGSNNGQTLSFQFGGSYDLNEGDEIVVVFEEVQNPDAGDYQIPLDINPQSSGGETEATLSIGSGSGDSTATDSSASDGSTATESGGASVEGDAEASGDASVSAPGFGAGLTVLALLGAAFVAVRRRD